MQPIIYIVDDDASVRHGLSTLLEVSGYKVETFDCGEALLDWNPVGLGCILLDVSMSGLNGFQVQRALVDRNSRIPIIFLTAFSDVPRVVSAMKNGAEDFFIKPVDGAELVARIEQAIKKFDAQLAEAYAQKKFSVKLNNLTDREREILKLSIDGLSCKEIGNQLGLSHRTVESHRSHICTKAGVANLFDLLSSVSKAGLTFE